MNWTAFDFGSISDEVIELLIIILPIAIALYAIYMALRFSKKVINNVGSPERPKEPWESYDIWTDKFDKDQMDKFYDHHILGKR